MQGVPWTNPACPVLFINIAEGSEQQALAGNNRRGGSGDSSGASYSNSEEAEVAMKALQRVLQEDDSVQSIVLLSPYK